MDKNLSIAVNEAFLRFYEKGIIYRYFNANIDSPSPIFKFTTISYYFSPH